MLLQSLSYQSFNKPEFRVSRPAQTQSFGQNPPAVVMKEIGNVQFMDDFSIILKEPKNLYDGVCDILSAMKQNKETKFAFQDRLSQVLKLSEKPDFEKRKLHGIIGAGNNSVALEIDNKEVLSVSNTSPFYGRCVESFDLPIIKEGFSGIHYYNIRPYGDVDSVTMDDLKALKQDISQKGYRTRDLEDYKTYQACKYNTKTYLLDAQCAYR
jgi:hypothetical protein